MKRKKEKDTKPSAAATQDAQGILMQAEDVHPRWISSVENDHQHSQKHQLHYKSQGLKFPGREKTASDSLQEKKKEHEERSLEKMLKHEVPFQRKSSRSSLCGKGQEYSHGSISHSTNSC